MALALSQLLRFLFIFLATFLPSTSLVSSFTMSSTAGAKLAFDLVVIGGGSAGLTAAKLAATFDKSVVIIEKDRMGGVRNNNERDALVIDWCPRPHLTPPHSIHHRIVLGQDVFLVKHYWQVVRQHMQ